MVGGSLSRTAIEWLLAVALALFVSCGSEKKEWERTRATDTVEGYTAFLKNYPQSDLTDQVYTRLQELTVGWSFKIQLVCVLNEAGMFGQGQRWKIKDEAKNKGVAILLETSGFDPAKGIPTAALFAGYESTGKTMKSLCKGIGLGAFISRNNPGNGAWFLGEEANHPGFNIFAENKDGVYSDISKNSQFYKEIWLLYVVPREVNELTIMYHDVRISRPFPVKDAPQPVMQAKKPDRDGDDGTGTVGEDVAQGLGVEDGVVPKPASPDVEPTRAPEDEAPVRVMGAVKPPNLIKEISPVYPESAKLARIEGTVILEVKTDTRGRVSECRVLRGHPLLNAAAIDAVRQWEYEPVIIGGKPRSVIFTVTVKFILPE